MKAFLCIAVLSFANVVYAQQCGSLREDQTNFNVGQACLNGQCNLRQQAQLFSQAPPIQTRMLAQAPASTATSAAASASAGGGLRIAEDAQVQAYTAPEKVYVERQYVQVPVERIEVAFPESSTAASSSASVASSDTAQLQQSGCSRALRGGGCGRVSAAKAFRGARRGYFAARRAARRGDNVSFSQSVAIGT